MGIRDRIDKFSLDELINIKIEFLELLKTPFISPGAKVLLKEGLDLVKARINALKRIQKYASIDLNPQDDEEADTI